MPSFTGDAKRWTVWSIWVRSPNLLAAELAQAAALAYPSTYPETSCIAALEAMSVGAAVLTTRSGAMPETTAGFWFDG